MVAPMPPADDFARVRSPVGTFLKSWHSENWQELATRFTHGLPTRYAGAPDIEDALRADTGAPFLRDLREERSRRTFKNVSEILKK